MGRKLKNMSHGLLDFGNVFPNGYCGCGCCCCGGIFSLPVVALLASLKLKKRYSLAVGFWFLIISLVLLLHYEEDKLFLVVIGSQHSYFGCMESEMQMQNGRLYGERPEGQQCGCSAFGGW